MAIGVLTIGFLTEFECSDIFLVLAHEEILDFGAATDRDDQEARGQRIKRSAMPDFLVLSARRVMATTSCDVIACDLSTSNTPSMSVPDLIR